MNKRIQSSDSVRVAILLTIVGGFLEIYSYVYMNNVFATAITGNIVLLAYNLKNLRYAVAFKYSIPILSFMLGVFISELIKGKLKSMKITHWRNIILVVELIILISLSLITNIGYIGISLISFTSAIQVQTFKKIESYSYYSTMLTGNTRQLVEAIVHKEKNKIKDFIIIIVSFIIGVILADITIELFDRNSIYLPIFLILIVMFLVNRKEKDEIIK